MEAPRQQKLYTPFRYWNRLLPTTGMLSFASFLVAVLSGVVLAFFYDVHRPLDSLEVMATLNRPAHLFRSLHYWSGQLFMGFFLLHFLEYLLLRGDRKILYGVWSRLVLSLFFIFFVMLSGFMLKGDREGLLATRILRGLLAELDSGQGLSFAVLGQKSSLQILYMHHIATATIFVLYIIVEHSRRIWPTSSATLYALAASLILSVAWPVALLQPHHQIIKGPWYFLGLQEALHWMSSPVWLWPIIGLVFLALLALPRLHGSSRRWIEGSLYIAILVYALLTLIGAFFRGGSWSWVWPWG